MPEGGKVTPISPSFVQRVAQGIRYAISGVTPSTWFGPLQPLQPMAPGDVKGRQFDYKTGVNLQYNPRSNEPVSFEDLRALADNCDILRSVIETRKDQMEAQEWSIKIKPDDQNKRSKATGSQQKRIDAITEFFQSPDKEHTWEQWQRMLLEDMFVIDAACIFKRRNRKGELYSLDILDGATIKILADDEGRRPLAPDPAYQQVLHGIPAADYTSEELLYLKHNPRSNRFYGYSHVEQVLVTVNILIRRTLYQLEYYREGSVPDAFLFAPPEWTTEQIIDFQKYVDGLLSGNLAQRRKLRILPKSEYKETKAPVLKDEYDEFLARIICFVFSLPPTAFVKQVNRATAESAKEQAAEEGLAPILNWLRKNLNLIIATDFKSPDLEFAWGDTRELDPATAATIRQGDVKSGIISIDEGREDMGLDPLGGAYAVPMPLTTTGYVAIRSPEEQQADQDAQQKALSDAASARMGHNGAPEMDDEHGGGDEGGNQARNKKVPQNPKDTQKLAQGLKKKPNPYLPTTEHRHGSHAPLINKVAKRVLTATGKSVAGQLKKALDKLAKADSDDDQADGIVTDLDLGLLSGLSAVQPWIDSAASDRAESELVSLGISEQSDFFSHANDRAAAYADERAASMVSDIDESTRDMLRQKIAAGLQAGLMREDIIQSIEDSDVFSERRATLIADTEVAMANGQGALAGYKEAKDAGVKLKKIWICTEDPCPDCEENQDAGAIEIEAEFPSGDDAEVAHPFCRCHTESVVEENSEESDDADE